MTKNKYFNTGRFARLFRNDLLINQKTYLFTLAGLLIAVYAFSFLGLKNSNTAYAQNSVYLPNFIFYLFGIGALIGTAFPALTNQIKTSNYLLAPGSTFEKYMVQFVIRIVLFIPLALFIFWVGTHLAKVSLVPDPKTNFDPSKIPYFHFSDLIKDAHLTIIDKLAIVLSLFSAASILFAGSVYFTRFALVKTLIFSGTMVFAVILSFVLFSHIFYPAETHGFHIQLKTYKITENLFNVQLAAYLLGGLSWIFFLVFGYFKLKEKEV
jgi:hypothetical protein